MTAPQSLTDDQVYALAALPPAPERPGSRTLPVMDAESFDEGD